MHRTVGADRSWRWAFIAIAISMLSCGAGVTFAQRERVYLAPDDHTDYVWTGDEEQYRKSILEMTDYYLDLSDKTAAEPSDFQSRWNMDGSLWMWIWEHNRSPEQIQRLVGRLRDGHFSMPLNFAVSTYGGMPTEAVLRSMYYSGQVERRYNLRFPMAIAMEDQTVPRGLGALWAGSGARYSWRGVCGCATQFGEVIRTKRPNEIYWWKAPDGSKILMKWFSLLNEDKRDGIYYPGTYLEANNPAKLDTIPLLASTNFLKRYPYRIVGIFGEGGDNLSTMNDQFVQAAKKLSGPDREVIVSNEEDFFRDFEAHYGAALPSSSAGYGNEWDLLTASMQEVSSTARRATEKLRGAEAMETLVSMKRPDFPEQFTKSRDLAWTAFGLFWEHDWTADSPTITRSARADFERRTASQIVAYVDKLSEASNQAFGAMIVRHGDKPRYFVFNPLSWQRTDAVDLPYSGTQDAHVVDLETGKDVPSQFVDASDEDGVAHRSLRILASDIPSVGYKVYEVRPGKGKRFVDELQATGSMLENSSYRVEVNDRCALTSLIAKHVGGREIAARIDGRQINDIGPGEGSVRIKDDGPVSVTMDCTTNGPSAHETQVTLYRGLDKISIRNSITTNFSDVKTWAFSFNLKSPDVWHEEIGAINHARLEPAGDYAAKFSRLDWLTLNHFVTMTGQDGVGVTLSNTDDSFMKLGRSKMVDGLSQLDTTTPQISVLAGGQVDGPSLGIPAQGGDRRFLQRFALQVSMHPTAADSMRFALEHQNPLLSGVVTGGTIYPEKQFSALSISNSNVMLWALKPAESGTQNGVAARFWNMSAQAANFGVQVNGGIAKAWNMTHIETDTDSAEVKNSELQSFAGPWQLRSYRIQPVVIGQQVLPHQPVK